jgi:protein-S-isoprenylcysteine O-methyltransferase Ste14
VHYWQAWVYLGIIVIPMILFSAYYYKHDPALVERRMRTRETEPRQKAVMRAASVVTLVALMVPGLDRRYGWSTALLGAVPTWLIAISLALTLASYLATMWVMDVNRFAGRTIQVEAEQRVVSSGPYGIVRHPMYAASLFMMLFTPLALGSYVAVPFCALYIPILIARLLNEEQVLGRGLPGYAEYCQSTRYRLLPGIW